MFNEKIKAALMIVVLSLMLVSALATTVVATNKVNCVGDDCKEVEPGNKVITTDQGEVIKDVAPNHSTRCWCDSDGNCHILNPPPETPEPTPEPPPGTCLGTTMLAGLIIIGATAGCLKKPK